MKRFFFDAASATCVRYDYQGREFDSTDQARSFAELVALDLGISGISDDENRAAEIQVRNVHGEQLFSIPVAAEPSISLVAA